MQMSFMNPVTMNIWSILSIGSLQFSSGGSFISKPPIWMIYKCLTLVQTSVLCLELNPNSCCKSCWHGLPTYFMVFFLYVSYSGVLSLSRMNRMLFALSKTVFIFSLSITMFPEIFHDWPSMQA